MSEDLKGQLKRALARAKSAERSEERLKHALRVIGVAVDTTNSDLALSRAGISQIVKDALRAADLIHEEEDEKK